jgi:hypothetical protein
MPGNIDIPGGEYGPEGGPALRFMDWLMQSEGKVGPEHRARALAALRHGARKPTLASAIRSFAANGDGQKEVLDELARVADDFWDGDQAEARDTWDFAIEWLETPGATLSWSEERVDEERWEVKKRFEGMNVHLTVVLPRDKACKKIEISDDDLFR